MRSRLTRLGIALGLVLGLTATLAAQSLSQQVLQLLNRVNTWTATNTFMDLRLIVGVPSDTALRFYVDGSNNLYFNGVLVAGASGGAVPHNLLSTTHPDTLPAGVARGAVIVGNATPAWSRLTVCAAGSYLGSDGTDTGCRTSAASFTAIPAGEITGTASAFDGNAITNLNATNLGTGTVPLGRLSGIVNAQIGAGAGIAYSKLALTGAVLNADLAGSIAYSKLVLTGSVVTGDLAAATLLFDRWASNGCTNLQVPQYNGAAWVCKSLVASDVTGAGTVTSVGLAAPAIFTITNSPVTTTGTLTATLATQTANLVWAGPTTGAAATPTFRALVNADFPLTGVAAGTYAKVTVNTAGLVTAASAQITLTTDVAGILPMANGGTGVGVSADDSVLVGSGTAWVAQTLPNCPTGAVTYTQATNLFSCNTSLLSASPSAGVGYTTGAGCAISQGTSRTTTVVCTGTTGAITLFSAAGSATPATFTVTDTSVAATDTIILNQKSGTDLYELFVTTVSAGSFKITFFTTGGTTTEQPVINFAVLKGVTS